MSKRILVIIVALALVIGGGIAVLALSPSTPEAAPQTTPTPVLEVAPQATDEAEEEEAAEVTPGAYVDYSDTALAAADGTRLLFFHAPWCPQCRTMEEDILASGVPDGVTILKVDYDSNQALRQQYGVTLQTTFVELDAAGNPVQTFVAYDEPSMSAVVAALL